MTDDLTSDETPIEHVWCKTSTHAATRDDVRAWESKATSDKLRWGTGDISPGFREAVLPSLQEHGAVRMRLLDDPENHSLEVLDAFVLAFARQLGAVVPQTHENNVIAHIRDEGKDYGSHRARGHQTNAELAFHSDRCDIIMLFYVRAAAEGGQLSVVSYQEVAESLRNQDLSTYDTLFKEFPFDLREERIFENPKWYRRPILWKAPNGICGHYIRRFINDSQRHDDCPRMTAIQINALDCWDRELSRLRTDHSFSPRAGELVILDNYKVMHARTRFTDSISEREGRLAIRAWLAPYNSGELPDFLLPISGSVKAGTFRGGVGKGKNYLDRLDTRVSVEEATQ